MANELKIVEDSPTTVISLTASITDGSIAGGTTSLDNTTNAYPYATAELYLPDGFGSSINTGGTFTLFMEREDVSGGTDDDTPTGQADSLEPVGTFRLNDHATPSTAQRRTISIDLAGALTAKFYIRNNTGATATYSATAITVKVMPYTVAPS